MSKASLFVVVAALATASVAHAQTNEYVSIDLYVGPYSPSGNQDAFDQYFHGDRGPLLGLDAFFHVYRIPHVGPLGVTASVGWARYAGHACQNPTCSGTVDEAVRLDLFPFGALATLRIDSLWTDLRIPFFLQGGIGADYTRFRVTKGGVREGYGGAFGLRWQAQIGFILDSLEPRAARALDEEQGINHSYLFFELRGSTASSAVPVADRFTWLGGLGLTF